MPEATLLYDKSIYRFTAATSYSGGEILKDPNDGRAAVVEGLNARASGDEVAACKEGVFNIASASATTFSSGDPVYWDASASLAIVEPGDVADFYLGRAVIAKTSGQTVVRVQLNANPEKAYLGAFTSRRVLLDHADAAEYDVLSAADNPHGMMVLAFVGHVTEQPAGSSEDQLVIDLQDEDDNVLSQMTTTDSSPDAAGDWIQGTRTLATGTTGLVASIVPAGKAAKVLVSQPTVGTPAGAVRVQAVFIPLF